MDDRTVDRIVEQATYVRESVTLLAEIRETVTLSTYRDDRRKRDIVEREFQTSIEACLDIGSMVLQADGETVPETNADVFRHLAAKGVLDESCGRRMAEAAGFRNVLAHQYGTDINDEDVFNFLQHDLDLFGTYLRQIRSYLDEGT